MKAKRFCKFIFFNSGRSSGPYCNCSSGLAGFFDCSLAFLMLQVVFGLFQSNVEQQFVLSKVWARLCGPVCLGDMSTVVPVNDTDKSGASKALCVREAFWLDMVANVKRRI